MTNSNKLLTILCMITIWLISSSVVYALKISEMIVPMTNQSKRIFVENDSESDAFADIKVERIINPGLENEKKEVFAMGTDPEKFGLLVPSQEIVIPTDDRKYISLILTKEQEKNKERVFFVTVTPFQGVRRGKKYKVDTIVSAGMKMIFAYQIKVIQLPENIKYDLTFEEVKKTTQETVVNIVNKGNSYQRIALAYICPKDVKEPDWGVLLFQTKADAKAKCLAQPIQFLYPNMKQEYKVPKGDNLYLLIRARNKPLQEWPVEIYKNP